MTLSDSLLQSFSEYPFDDDAEFQTGLSEILGAQSQSGTKVDDAAVANIVGQAKAFYFSSKCGVPFSWEEYLQQSKNKSENDSESRTEPHPLENEHTEDANSGTTRPSEKELSFAQITALIESGQTHLIPNNESVPGGLNDASPSESIAGSTRKPWEKELGTDETATA